MENFKKINIGNIDNNIPHDSYSIDESFDDTEKGCIHVPARMVKTKGVIDIDHFDIIDQILPEVIVKFKDKNFAMSGGANEWKSISVNKEKWNEEYLFFYQNPK